MDRLDKIIDGTKVSYQIVDYKTEDIKNSGRSFQKTHRIILCPCA